MKIRNLILVIAMQLTGACAAIQPEQGSCTMYLNEFVVANADADANRNVNLGEKYILGIQGYSITFPGVEDQNLPKELGYKVMQGTSDVIVDDSCALYQQRAREYAERYNKRLLQILMKNFGQELP